MIATRKTMDRLGVGFYTPTEAAAYAKVSPTAVHRWLFGAANSRPAVRRQILDADENIVTFFDFVQILAIRNARRDGVSLQKIRNGIEKARKLYDVQFPLAHQHDLVVFDGELHIIFPDQSDMRDLTGLPGQGVMLEIAEPFMNRLQFDAEGMADRYTVLQSEGSVTMDPERQFGEPVVGETGYTAHVLFQAYLAEGSIARAAKAFGVSEADILTAVEFHDDITKVAA